MEKPDRKEIKRLKGLITRSILKKITSIKGYELTLDREVHDCNCVCSPCTCGSTRPEILVVDCQTTSIPVVWHAGIEGNSMFDFGYDLPRVNFASEEAKRTVRDLFPGHESFVTWAWYN